MSDAELMGEDRSAGGQQRAGIAGADGGIPDHAHVRGKGEGDLLGKGLDFLQAENVGIFGGEILGESFVQTGANAVDVPGDNFHGMSEGEV